MKTERIAIDLAALTDQDWIDVRAIAARGGVALDAGMLADPPVPVLAGLIYVTLRREHPKVTPRRCVALALAAKGGADGAR